MKLKCFFIISIFILKPAVAHKFESEISKQAPTSSSPAITKSNTKVDNNINTESDVDLIWQGVASSFALPFDTWALDKDKSNDKWLHGLSGNIAIHFPLLKTEPANLPADVTTGPTTNNMTATLSLKYTVLGNWFVSGTAYYYFDREQQQPWNPDFTYVFGYSDWRPYTLSLVYANYGGNRFKATSEQPRTNFQQGTWSLGWKFPITPPILNWLSFTDDGSIGCQINYNYTKEYFDLASTTYKNNHQTMSLGCKYAIVGNWYVNGTAFHYFDDKQQQPWNPDYTYGFGYFDWRPGTITVQYNNYSGNRWSKSERGEGTGRFKDGSITVAYSFTF